MKHSWYIFILSVFILTSCSSGKKALQKGDYFSAVTKAVERLKSSPDNRKAGAVLKDAYPLTLQWAQEEIDLILTSNAAFKWEKTLDLMNQVNRLSSLIRRTPAARNLIPDPKSYGHEIDMAREKAAEERYEAGLIDLDQNSREAARSAYDHFSIADRHVPGYKDVNNKLVDAKNRATVVAILEAIPVNTVKYKLSSTFMYDQVFEYLNGRYPVESFVHFYSPAQARKLGLERPDFVVRMEFFDFSVGNLVRSEKEEVLERKVKIESEDTTKAEYNIYKAKLKTFTDEVISNGTLRFNIVEHASQKLLRDELIPGSFTWINDYAIYVGDIEALNKKQKELTKRKAVPLPPEQNLFIEFTRPIYDKVIVQLNRFFRRYN